MANLAIGMIETKGYVGAVEASDAMAKEMASVFARCIQTRENDRQPHLH